MSGVYLALMAVMAFCAFWLAKARAQALAGAGVPIHSRPVYHGLLAASFVIIPALAILALGAPLAVQIVEGQALRAMDPALLHDALRRGAALRDIQDLVDGRYAGTPDYALQSGASAYAYAQLVANLAVTGLGLGCALAGLLFALRSISAEFRARNRFERIVTVVLMLCAGCAVLTTIGIVFSVVFETVRFFQKVPAADFLFGTQWSPQTAIRADQGGSSGAFGIVPLVTGTFLISGIAMLVAGPVGLFAAIYMAEYASPRLRSVAKPVLELLAGIPTVVLGFFAALTIAPLIRNTGEALGLSVASESALAAGLVMGVMIIPFVSSLSDDVITAVPQSLRDGSLGMGATQSETIRKVVLPAALPGIVSAFMLAISRAVGETMIVVMAAGLAANLTFNPLEAVTTFTVQIKTILVGDQEFDSAKTLAAFALGFVLFFFTLTLNVIALAIARKYREQYD
jgi:phosphate transport system permease protein